MSMGLDKERKWFKDNNFLNEQYLTGTNKKYTHMCTGGNLVVRQNAVVLSKIIVG